jgi:hypothetical protein
MDRTTQFYQDMKGAFSSAEPDRSNDPNNTVIYSILFTKKTYMKKLPYVVQQQIVKH